MQAESFPFFFSKGMEANHGQVQILYLKRMVSHDQDGRGSISPKNHMKYLKAPINIAKIGGPQRSTFFILILWEPSLYIYIYLLKSQKIYMRN